MRGKTAIFALRLLVCLFFVAAILAALYFVPQPAPVALVLAALGGFVVALGGAGGILSALSVAPMLLIVAILLLELLVAFLQAYVFAILTCIYLNEALHLHDQH